MIRFCARACLKTHEPQTGARSVCLLGWRRCHVRGQLVSINFVPDSVKGGQDVDSNSLLAQGL